MSGDLVLGGRYQVEGNAGGTIESCDPPRNYTVTWESGSRTAAFYLGETPPEEA